MMGHREFRKPTQLGYLAEALEARRLLSQVPFPQTAFHSGPNHMSGTPADFNTLAAISGNASPVSG
jgi:hypothetical protein